MDRWSSLDQASCFGEHPKAKGKPLDAGLATRIDPGISPGPGIFHLDINTRSTRGWEANRKEQVDYITLSTNKRN